MMNTAELKELAAVLTGIADRKPWQMRSSENVEWGLASDGADPMDVIKAGFQIRLKPWELGRSINGHTLPPGAEWHRQDFTEDMLPAPYRPLMLGEAGEYQFLCAGTWHDGQAVESSTSATDNHNRTTRPIPFALTPAQIADGWLPWSGGECPVEPESRPTVVFRNKEMRDTKPAKDWAWHDSDGQWIIIAYKPDPYGNLRQALADGKEIEHQANVGGQWYSLINAMEVDFIAPPDRYRIKEPQWVKLGPGDVPPGSMFRNLTRDYTPVLWWSVAYITEEGVALNCDSGVVTFSALEKSFEINRPRHRDADGNPTLWEPCRKQAP